VSVPDAWRGVFTESEEIRLDELAARLDIVEAAARRLVRQWNDPAALASRLLELLEEAVAD
jgi:hypothetical protein